MIMVKNGLIILLLSSIISCNSGFTDKERSEYLKNGKEIATNSFKELSTQLTTQMEAGGPAQAIPFCKAEALNILGELSEKHNAIIKRSSDQLRSCKIEPTHRELDVINMYKQLVSEKKELNPIIEIDAANKKHFYAPIIVQAKCLTCHGEVNKTMTVKTDSIIKSIYPFDIATGYREGDVRGVWSITFNK